MFVKIPFESTLDFKNNIYEITKMSLEHDFNVNEDAVLGNFYITGEYRTNEVSVNQESFNFTLPFTVELSSRVAKDTLTFNIEDFTYDIVDNNKLKVNIEYSLEGEEIFEELDENLNREVEELATTITEDKEPVNEEKKEEERVSLEEEKTIMEEIEKEDDTFVTYHIHIVKENETLEMISNLYNVNPNIIKEYNNVDNFNIGDKLLIPSCDE